MSETGRRPTNALAMAADHLLLSGRYPDVDAGLVHDLISASAHAMWAPYSLPSRDDTVAYLDRVVGLLRAARVRAESTSDADLAGSKRLGAGDVDFHLLTMRQVHLGKGAWSDAAVAHTEQWLAVQRPDLDRELLRELCLAGYIRHRRERLTPTRESVLALLNRIAPAPVAAVADGGAAPAGLPLGSRDTLPRRDSRERRPALPEERGVRQSLDGQEPGVPYTADLLARAAGGRPREEIEPPALAAPARPRRARGLADPRAAFERALVQTIHLGESRLSKTAIATYMGVDRKTLSRYIEDGLIPPPPWESLAADLSGTSRPSNSPLTPR